MRAVIQRVSRSEVLSNGTLTGHTEIGLVVLLGIRHGDAEEDADKLAKKIANLRIFSDENDKLNKSVNDVNGSVLVVSNFTLYANYAHGNRPDYFESEEPVRANELYEYFVNALRPLVPGISTGIFGADMKISMENDGPITIVMDSEILTGKGSKK